MFTFSSRLLCDVFLVVGFIGFVCGLTLHCVGCGNPAVPISVEYANWNPLAIGFVWSTFSVAAVASLLYWRIPNHTESFLMTCATLSLGTIAITDHSSIIHGVALFSALFSITAVPVINALRGEIGLGTIAFVSMNLATTSVLALMSFAPNSPFGLGLAERIWFAVVYLCNAWVLDVVHLDD